MTIKYTVDKSTSSAHILILGRFDFALHKSFRDSYKNLEGCRLVVVDLSGVDYMDSAALGMLLLLREHAHSVGAKVKLCRPKENVSRVLEIANFSRLFEIE